MSEENSEIVFVYGSLRKGMYNYRHFENNLEYLESKTIEGFRMHSLGAFPFVVKDPEHSITIDVMKATPTAKKAIDRMEFGAGYEEEIIEVDDYKGSIYIYNNERRHRGLVESGDWVKYKNQ